MILTAGTEIYLGKSRIILDYLHRLESGEKNAVAQTRPSSLCMFYFISARSLLFN